MKGTKPVLREATNALDAVEPPDWLSAAARAEWDRVIPDLTQRRILTNADLGGLENYCVAIGRVRQMETAIQQTLNPDDMLKLVRAQDKAMATARQLAAELGLTPVSRSRPSIRDDAESDDTTNPLSMG